MKEFLKTVLPGSVRRLLSADGRMTYGPGAGLRFDPGPSNHHYASGDNELPVQEFLAAHLKPGGTFYDVGANVGFLTVIGAKLVGPSGQVYAFEPVTENLKYITENVRVNGFQHVSIIEKAVSSKSGTGELAVAEYSGGSVLTSAPPPPDLAGIVKVPLVSLDDCVFRNQFRQPSLVKIDVEGAEMDVFEGMRETIARFHPVILYEIDDQAQDAFDAKCARYARFLTEAGYRVERLADSYPNTNWIVGHAVALPA